MIYELLSRVINKSVILVLICFAFAKSYSQTIQLKDTAAYFKPQQDTTSRKEEFLGISLKKHRNNVIILIKHDSLFIIQSSNKYIESFQKLNEYVKEVLEKKKNATFEIDSYGDLQYQSTRYYSKVVKILKENGIFNFDSGIDVAPYP